MKKFYSLQNIIYFLRNLTFTLLHYKNFFFEDVFSVASPGRKPCSVAATCRFVSFLLFVSFSVSIQANALEQNQFFQDDIPTIKYSVINPKLPATERVKGEFTIHVFVPKNHHAYLDKGDKGVFIPLKFDFSGVESAGYKIAPISSPKGIYDNEVNARVLRGKGEFKFSIHRIKGREYIIPPIKARSQICNDTTKICYFPRTDNIPLTINIK